MPLSGSSICSIIYIIFLHIKNIRHNILFIEKTE